MSYPQSPALPSTARLVRATLVSILVGAVILVTTVLPAEYGIDPTGIGARLGLDALQSAVDEPAASAESPPAAPVPAASTDTTEANTALAARAAAAFGANAGQSLDAAAFSASPGELRTDTFSVTLEPGKGAEVKSALKAGDGLVFRWTASADVAVDMHGEAPDAKGTWTSYAVEAAQREAAGTFVAAFDGTHGWYWQNRGTEPVTIKIVVTGFQPSLYRP
ncbi:MAG: hypothetical protein K0M70_06590 [Arenimonas sp.]|uniref:hypothetical protein n=1 Tax=Arenimonas sp. TaxID=1872635 RepID=UPI0025C03DCE|nr:hypothetical protein [Arenimonas sp.]MBW8367510.1 hypothetical protein [Arenimonas sp.]